MQTDLIQVFERAYYGITVSKRDSVRYGIRLQPYVEVYSTDIDFLELLHMELLKKSVSSVVRPRFLRIQGIQNCLILRDFCPMHESWWKDCLVLFEKGSHLNPEGIFKIVKMRDNREGARSMVSKVTLAEVVKIVLKA